MLKNIWGILWRPLRVQAHKSSKFIGVAIKLQKYVIDLDASIFKARSAYKNFEATQDLDWWISLIRDFQDPGDFVEVCNHGRGEKLAILRYQKHGTSSWSSCITVGIVDQPFGAMRMRRLRDVINLRTSRGKLSTGLQKAAQGGP